MFYTSHPRKIKKICEYKMPEKKAEIPTNFVLPEKTPSSTIPGLGLQCVGSHSLGSQGLGCTCASLNRLWGCSL